MWNNARLLNLVANALFALSGLLAASAAGVALVRSPAFALRSIEVEGELTHVRRPDIVAVLEGRVSGTFFTVDLDALRARFELIPWVRRAEVRRHWPDRLVVRLEEHVPLAHWGVPEDGRLVDVQGEVFAASEPSDLPVLAGPAGSEREVVRRYAEFSTVLAPLKFPLRQVLLTDRLAWELRSGDGLVLELGRDLEGDPVSPRLQRFVQAYPATLQSVGGDRAEWRVDLRYPNGFALRVPGIDRTIKERTATARPA